MPAKGEVIAVSVIGRSAGLVLDVFPVQPNARTTTTLSKRKCVTNLFIELTPYKQSNEKIDLPQSDDSRC